MRAPSELDRLLADPSVKLAVARGAALNVLRSHQATGDPVLVWRDGRTVNLDQHEIALLIEERMPDPAAGAPHAA